MLLKKFGLIILTLVIVVSLSSCGKKQPTLEEMQQPIAPEELSRLTAQNMSASAVSNEASQAALVQDKRIEQVSGVSVSVSKPTNQDIQTALKNAGFYAGDVDGKIGPKSKKAIEEFQKANGLNADGKVGAKTWSVLGAYLNAAPVTAEPAASRSKANRY
jgi:peptidoglycan hydrolase-like protein with peptidoglycan-binding domain